MPSQYSLNATRGAVAPARSGTDRSSAPVTRFLDRANGHIAYDDSGGTGTLIVASPGMGNLRQQYRFLRPLLIQAGYRFVSLDVRGHGESSAKWTDYSSRAIGCDMLALIHHLGATKAVLLGNSFAAGAALWAAYVDPDAVQCIGMLGPIMRDLPVYPLTRAMVRIGFAVPWRT